MADNALILHAHGYTFTYHPVSGGVVVTCMNVPIDAGVIHEPGEITETDLRSYAAQWWLWQQDMVRRARRITFRNLMENHG